MIKSSSFGSLYKAVESGARHIVVDQSYKLMEPVRLPSGLTLELRPGIMLEAGKGGMKDKYDCLLWAEDQDDICIIGYGASLRMRQNDYRNAQHYQKSEHRHGIGLRGCRDVSIHGINTQWTGGDGIYVGPIWKGCGPERKPCENITICDVTIDKSYRNGIAIVAGKNVYVDNVVVRNTGGTNPQAGIDIEPSEGCDPIKNILVQRSQFLNSAHLGVSIYLKQKGADDDPVSVTFEDCLVRGRSFHAGVLVLSDAVKGFLSLDIKVENVIGDDWHLRGWHTTACGLERL